MAYELVNEKTVCPQKSKKIMIEMEIKHYLDDKKKCIPIQSLNIKKIVYHLKSKFIFSGGMDGPK